MSREWKPGDVAMVTARWNRTDDHWEQWAVRVSAGWTSRTGVHAADWETSSARPLVVIDPGDREQVERLVSRWTAAEVGDGLSFVDALQAALRSLVVPPKPEEPRGLGAVVEDSRGNRWIRCVHGATQATWKQEDHVSVSDWTDYADIAAVKVLSEGVTP